MTRVIHTGDTHLGYRQYHRPERKRDYLDAFQQVVDDAVAEDVDAVVHAGDLFHDRRPTLEDIMGTLSVLRTLDDAGVPFLAVVGNHEAKREGQWLDLFESLGLATRLDHTPVEIGRTAFYGLDFVPRSRREDFSMDCEGHGCDHAALVTHGLFEPFDFGEWDPREIFEAADTEFDALLLGDNHHPDTAEVDGTWVTYCGSTERTSAAERAERGYNLVTFDGDVDVRRRGLDTREFVFVDVELGEGEGAERVRQCVGEYDVADAVVVVNVEGDGEPVTPAAVEEYALDQGALVARVNDRRETPEESEREVTFADPDDAVRERVRELGLSGAARSLDETVRASKVADSNVAETVESQVRDLVDEGDASEFAAAGSESAEEAAEPTADDGAGAADAAATADGGVTGQDSGGTDDGSPGAEPAESTEAEPTESTEAEPTGSPEASQNGASEAEPAGSPETEPNDPPEGDGEDQSTMGEYL